jgi:cytochrome c oxidase assembly protein subunit 11
VSDGARPAKLSKTSRLIAWIAGGAAVLMFAGSFAAEPLYSTFCRVTGFGGTTRIATKAPDTVLARSVRVRFDTNIDKDAPLAFKPVDTFVDVKLGEKVLTFFEVTNTSDKPVRAMATFNVAPHKIGVYFDKLECFCFKEKVFQPGSTERLPVVFFVSPEMAKDPTANDVKGITLSYTYYRSQEPLKATARLEDASRVN